MLNVLTATELYFQTTSAAGSNYRYIETFMVSAVLYLILTTLASFLLNYLEKRMDSESSMKDFCSQEDTYGNNYSNSTSPETFWKS